MNSFDADIKKYTDKIRLKASERRELRERIFAYMEYHPLAKQESHTQAIIKGIPSESFIAVHFNHLYIRLAGGVFALFLIAVPFFAELSMPGDVLYLIKTGVNEVVQAQLANSPYEKIEFETKLMNRRISEARVLAKEGNLTEETKNQITEIVKGHTAAVQQGLVELREQDAEGAAMAEITFNASLEVQSAMLDAEESTQNDSLVDSIKGVVNDAREGVVLSQGTNIASYEGLVAKVESQTTRAYELFATIKSSVNEDQIKDIDRRLSDINRLFEEAKSLSPDQKELAVGNLSRTLGLLQKLVVFMSDLDVRQTVPLANILPVVLSDTERTDVVREEIESVQKLKTIVFERIHATGTPQGTEKSTEALKRIDELLLQASVSLDTTNIGGAEDAMKEARALITDVDTITKRILPDGVVEEELILDTEPLTGDGSTISTTTASTTIKSKPTI